MNFLFEQSAQQNIAKGIIATSVNVTNQLPARNEDNHDLSLTEAVPQHSLPTPNSTQRQMGR